MRVVRKPLPRLPREHEGRRNSGALIETMKECGIDRAVAFAPFEEWTPQSVGDPNEWLARMLPSYPEIVGFACINPSSRDSVERLEKAWSLGLLGVKLHPAIQRFRLNDRGIYGFYSKAQELGVVLDFHTGVHGWRILEYHPLLLDDVAYTFPELKIIIEHVGGRSLYSDALTLLLNNGNVYAGISSCLNEEKHKAWYIGPERVEELARVIGADRMIYGTDFPYNKAEEIKRDIETIMGLRLTDDEKGSIMGGCLEGILTQR